jgi:hypothetical protein
MHYAADIRFQAATEAEARDLVLSWKLSPGVDVLISAFPQTLAATTDENGKVPELTAPSAELKVDAS